MYGGMTPLDACPWCGMAKDEPGTFDQWLESHVMDCEPWKAEQLGNVT